MHKQKLFVVIAAAIGIVGTVLPWWGCSGWINLSQNGLSFWPGYATIAACGAAIGVLFKDPDRSAPIAADVKKIVIGAGAGAVVFPLLFIVMNIGQTGSAMGQSCGFGFGVWLCILGGIGIAAATLAMKADGTFEMPSKDSIKADIAGDTGSADSGASTADTGASTASADTSTTTSTDTSADAGGSDAGATDAGAGEASSEGSEEEEA